MSVTSTAMDTPHSLELAPSCSWQTVRKTLEGAEIGVEKQIDSRIRRTHLPEGVKTKRWQDRMEKTQREASMKKLEAELKEEKQAEFKRRREVTLERKKAAEDRQRLEEDKAKMGARKAARLRRKEGRSKKLNQ
ncbi:hypothetical protein DFH11DRAFT_1722056 [Phellopilus nigrolimitatus]|nr:hypothetical protein DFH11DRAFT_1722056 [Phellopilus nigrolimitatus]